MRDGIMILDGGMGKLLEDIGAPFHAPEWSASALIEAPEYVETAHQLYIDAGADIITTNTYALVPFHIGEETYKHNGRELTRLAADIAKKVANNAEEDILVAGSIPPVFGSYRPDFFNAEAALPIYRQFIEEQDHAIDFWLVETISCLEEAKTVLRVLEQETKPVWISFTLKDRKNKNEPSQLRSGESLKDAVDVAIEFGASAILFNCSQVEEMRPALKTIQDYIPDHVRTGAYANAFQPIKSDHIAGRGNAEVRDDISPANYLAAAKSWIEHGATIIGGCCGIGPKHIEALNSVRN